MIIDISIEPQCQKFRVGSWRQ